MAANQTKSSINGVQNHSTLPFAVELMWNWLKQGNVEKARELATSIHPCFKDLAFEMWEMERRMPDCRCSIPPFPEAGTTL